MLMYQPLSTAAGAMNTTVAHGGASVVAQQSLHNMQKQITNSFPQYTGSQAGMTVANPQSMASLMSPQQLGAAQGKSQVPMTLQEGAAQSLQNYIKNSIMNQAGATNAFNGVSNVNP